MKKSVSILSNPIALSIGLLILSALTYGGLSPTLGLYWDDWPSVWFLHTYGSQIFPTAFAIDRPLQGYLFVLTTSIFGESLLAWQIFGILARWILGTALGALLLSLWPRKHLQVMGVVILFTVYPGFSQQNIAITYGHQQLIYALALFSFLQMIWAVRAPKKSTLLTVLSLLTGLMSMFALEYFYGLELLRPVFIWLALSQIGTKGIQRIASTIKRWLPYLLMNITFLLWRLSHATPRGEVTIFERLRINPGQTLSILLTTIWGDIYASAVTAWVRAISTLNFTGIKRSVVIGYILVAVIVGIASFILMLLAKSRSERNNSGSKYDLWGLTAVLIGVFALLVGGWPFWVTDLRLDLSVPWDRFTQPLMLGACLLLVGLIDLLIRPNLPKILFIVFLSAVSAGNQFYYAVEYRQEWIDQRAFFWQLAWRAPEIAPGTVLFTSQLPFHSSSDNSLTAGVNWMYAPDLTSRQMPYLMYDIEARLGNRLIGLEPNISIQQDYRATEFNGTTDQALVFFYKPPRCLKILDLKKDRHYPNKPGYVVLAMPLSKLDLIKEGTKEPLMPGVLNPEPNHSWCYYFEKVDLFAQLGKWDKAASFADQGLKVKPILTQDNAPELIPLIYTYAHIKKYDQALELSYEAGALSKKMHYYTCDTWYYLNQDIEQNPQFNSAYAEINQKFECTPP
jgi:hypothetical protein